MLCHLWVIEKDIKESLIAGGKRRIETKSLINKSIMLG